MVEDVFSCPSVHAWRDALYRRAIETGEHQVLTCDGTMKTTMGIMSRRLDTISVAEREREPDELGCPPGRPDVRVGSQTNVAFTIRGCNGFLFDMPIIDEHNSEAVAQATKGAIREHDRDAVHWVVLDKPNLPLLLSLQSALPKLRSLCQDTEHLSMRYKSAFGGKQTMGLSILTIYAVEV